jgi:mono/diheme cytochrome c family protein
MDTAEGDLLVKVHLVRDDVTRMTRIFTNLTLMLAVALLAGACQSEQSVPAGEEMLAYGNTVPFEEEPLPFPITMPSALTGRSVFEQACYRCHRGPEPPPVDFTDPFWNWQMTPGQLFNTIAYGESGHPRMSSELGVVEIWDAVAYTWSLNMPDADTLAEAAIAYGNSCTVCHGKTGFGNGPLAHNLYPKPQNFTDRRVMSEFTNEYLYFRISKGGQFEEIPESILQTMPRPDYHAQQWSAMPVWEGVLSPEERRLIINHLRALTIKLVD